MSSFMSAYAPLDAESVSILRRRSMLRRIAWTFIGSLAAVVVLLASYSPRSGSAFTNSDIEGRNGTSTHLKRFVHLTSSAMDGSVDPCDDFYRFSCGNFLKTFEMPRNFDEWWMKENVIEERVRHLNKGILRDNWPVISEFYTSCMDTKTIEELGAEPLRPWLERLSTIDSLEDVMLFAGSLHSIGIKVFFDLMTEPDAKNPEIIVAHIDQGGVAVPELDVYAPHRNPDAKITLHKYRLHVARMLAYSEGSFDVKGIMATPWYKKAHEAIDIEAEIAAAQIDTDDLSPLEMYHRMDLNGLKDRAPGVPWAHFFTGAGNANLQDIDVTVPEFVGNLSQILVHADLAHLRSYLHWHLVHGSAAFLSRAFVLEDFKFFKAELEGTLEMPSREFVCLQAADSEIGQLLGHYFAQRSFSEQSRNLSSQMCDQVVEAFVQHVEDVSWLDADGVRMAKDKARLMKKQIGYPDAWPTYEGMKLGKDKFFESTAEIRKYNFARKVQQVGKKPLPGEWTMTPSTVNAYYAPELNTMVVTAAQLQPPDFNKDYPLSANFGNIGTIMGHELSHGFDDEGTLYDEHGRLTDHWMPQEVLSNYEEKARCVTHLYEKEEPLPGRFIDGTLTLAENIADLAGVKLAYWGYRNAMLSKPGGEEAMKGPSVVPGLSDEQLFFVSYAHSWCTIMRTGHLKSYVRDNEHSPPEFRCNVPLRNFQTFSDVFQCPNGSRMSPPSTSRCDIWWE